MVFIEKSEGHWIPTDFKEYYIGNLLLYCSWCVSSERTIV